MATKKRSTSTLFIYKKTDANRLPISVLFCRFKYDFILKKSLPCCDLVHEIPKNCGKNQRSAKKKAYFLID
jgi:hypothetical protein